MSVAPAPIGDGGDGPSESALARLESREPTPESTSAPVVRETEEVERRRSRAVRVLWPPVRQHASLLGMELQPVLRETLVQHRHQAVRVVLPLERDDKVIGIADQGRFALKPRAHVLLEPFV